MKPIFYLIITVCIGVGYYAWQQQKNAINELKRLEKLGIHVTFSIISRPIIAVDAINHFVYLINGESPNKPIRFHFNKVSRIVFKEARTSNKNNTDPSSPDSLVIELNDGINYRVGDLPDFDAGARNAMAAFQQHDILTERLSIKTRP